MNFRFLLLVSLAVCAGYGQKAEFEVASIKPSAQRPSPEVAVGIHVDGAQVHCNYLSLKDYIRMAYRLKDYQITGVNWIGGERFDIDAKLPAGAKREDVPQMLQALLAERFKLKFHNEKKEFPIYALLASKGGVKLKESEVDAEGDAAAAKAPVNVTAGGGPQGVGINLGNGSYFNFGDNKIEAKKLTIAQFAETLARFTDRPIVDMTELTKRYDITIPLTPEDYRAMLIRSAVSAGVSLPPEALRLLETSSGDSLFGSVQSLGLKLEPRKAPLDVMVVDSIQRTPTEN